MGSFNEGKSEVVAWIHENIKRGATCLDVGACNGKWSKLLRDYLKMDAVEVWRPNVWGYKLTEKYDEVFQSNIIGFNYPKNYDLIIFGDVLEHMTVKEAQFVISEARKHADRILVAVPFLYEQGEKNGNPFEVHKQADLTHEIFMERYPGFEPIYMIDGYAYYVNEV